MTNSGYILDEELSQPNAKVFVDKKGRPNIAFRGSQHASDFLIIDPLLAFGLGKYDKRYSEAQNLTKKVQEKYNKKVDVFGHSLVGRDAEISGANGHIYIYDKASELVTYLKLYLKNRWILEQQMTLLV